MTVVEKSRSIGMGFSMGLRDIVAGTNNSLARESRLFEARSRDVTYKSPLLTRPLASQVSQREWVKTFWFREIRAEDWSAAFFHAIPFTRSLEKLPTRETLHHFSKMTTFSRVEWATPINRRFVASKQLRTKSYSTIKTGKCRGRTNDGYV